MKSLSYLPAVATLTFAGAANAHVEFFGATLTPEVTGSTGSGSVYVEYDDEGNTLYISATWANLAGPSTVAHIHGPTSVPGTGTAGVAVTPSTLPGFPTGLSSGNYSVVLDLSNTATYTGAFLGSLTAEEAEQKLVQSFYDGKAYFNLHSSFATGGEIRGFLAPIPEPGTWALMGLGFAAVAGAARRRNA